MLLKMQYMSVPMDSENKWTKKISHLFLSISEVSKNMKRIISDELYLSQLTKIQIHLPMMIRKEYLHDFKSSRPYIHKGILSSIVIVARV